MLMLSNFKISHTLKLFFYLSIIPMYVALKLMWAVIYSYIKYSCLQFSIFVCFLGLRRDCFSNLTFTFQLKRIFLIPWPSKLTYNLYRLTWLTYCRINMNHVCTKFGAKITFFLKLLSGQTDGRTDGQTDRHTHKHLHNRPIVLPLPDHAVAPAVLTATGRWQFSTHPRIIHTP